MRPYVLHAFLSCVYFSFTKMTGEDPASLIALAYRQPTCLDSNSGSRNVSLLGKSISLSEPQSPTL